MKTSLFSLLLVASGLALSAQAQTPAAALPEVDHWVYLAELPDPAELSQSAAANGLTVQRIDRTANAVVITYKYSDGVVGTMGYKLLSAAGSERVVVREQPVEERVIVEKRTTVIEDRDPEIIYVDRTPRTRVVYRERYNDNFWLPLSIGLGVGYISGHHSHHGHYRSHHYSHRGFHGGYRSHHGHRGRR